MDVKLAFLNGILNKKVFVEQSPQYIKEGKENQVYKLKKHCIGYNRHHML